MNDTQMRNARAVVRSWREKGGRDDGRTPSQVNIDRQQAWAKIMMVAVGEAHRLEELGDPAAVDVRNVALRAAGESSLLRGWIEALEAAEQEHA